MTTRPRTPLEYVMDSEDFPSADAKYLALVAVESNWSVSDDISGYTAPDEVSAIECLIFQIDETLVPALYWGYERYLGMIGCVTEYFGEFVEIERRDHHLYFRGECEWDFWRAVSFMVNVCKLPQPDSMGWVCKIIAAEVRGGLYKPEFAAAS